MRSIQLPVIECGHATHRSVDVDAATPLAAIPQQLACRGYRLVVTPRGRLAVERLH